MERIPLVVNVDMKKPFRTILATCFVNVEFMKKASVREILENVSFWDENLGYLTEEVEKYIGK